MGYVVLTKNVESALADINRVLGDNQLAMKTIQLGGTEQQHRIHFTTEAKHRDHIQVVDALKKCTGLERVEMLHDTEID
jgi:hypothetical protein